MKVKKLKIFGKRSDWTGCKWSSLNAQGIERPLYHFILKLREFPISQYGWDRGDWVPGVFKLDQLQPFKPILSWTFSNFFPFILGSPFLLPQRANIEKGEFFQLQIWMRQRGFSALGIQTGPFAALWAHFDPKDFQLFHFHTGRPILITPEG